jgi:hypothetical protein
MLRLGLLFAFLLLAGCSEDQSHLTPAERAKKGRGMSEDIWKIYSGTESGVADEQSDAAKKAPPGPANPEPPKGTR